MHLMKWEKINRNPSLIYTLIICLLVFLFIGYEMYKSKSEVIASVNGEKINRDQFYVALVESGGNQVLDTLITQKIIELEAEKHNIVISDPDIQNEMNKYYEYYGGEEGFKQALSASGYTLEKVRSDIINNLRVKKILEPQVSITETELQDYFTENKESFDQEEQVKASHILLDNLQTASEVKQKLNNGEDFALLAQNYSTDTNNKDNGGDLGYFSRGNMAEEFEEAAFALEIGQISEPVETEYGFHIIKLTDKKEAAAADYEQTKPKIKDILLEKNIGDRYDKWIQELYQQYDVQNYLIN